MISIFLPFLALYDVCSGTMCFPPLKPMKAFTLSPPPPKAARRPLARMAPTLSPSSAEDGPGPTLPYHT